MLRQHNTSGKKLNVIRKLQQMLSTSILSGSIYLPIHIKTAFQSWLFLFKKTTRKNPEMYSSDPTDWVAALFYQASMRCTSGRLSVGARPL